MLWAQLDQGVDQGEVFAMAQDFADELDSQELAELAEDVPADLGQLECEAEDKDKGKKKDKKDGGMEAMAKSMEKTLSDTGTKCFNGVCKGASDAVTGLCKTCTNGSNNLLKSFGDACSKGLGFCSKCIGGVCEKCTSGASALSDAATSSLGKFAKMPAKIVSAGTKWMKDHKFAAQVDSAQEAEEAQF